MSESPVVVDVALAGVTKTYGEVRAVDAIDLDIRRGEFFSLLGPSGCGKTTTLRLIAGFEHPDSGTVTLRGKDVTALPPYKRDVNTVFQNYELFPHLTVFDNVAYGLRMSGVRTDDVPGRVEEMLEIVSMEGLGARRPNELSGGQQQRVALARALVNRPSALLLDEPLSALDVQLRLRMQQELRQLQARLDTTFIYVTHDQEEAMVMSDRIAVMHDGQVLQVGAAREMYEQPKSSFVADFIGSLNVVSVRSSDQTRIRKPSSSAHDVSQIAIRPERISLRRSPPPSVDESTSYLVGEISVIDFHGSTWRVEVTGDGSRISAVVVNDGAPLPFSVGERVTASWPTDASIVVPS